MKKFVLENKYIRLEFLDLGGSIVSLYKKGTCTEYILHYQNNDDYFNNEYYFGATIGPVAGRIYPPYYYNYLGKKIVLPTNENNVHLHGADRGFDRQIWSVTKLTENEYLLELAMKTFEAVYVTAEMRYKLNDNNFIVEYTCHADNPTILNITNHSYFNLNKDKTKDIGNHVLKIAPSLLQLIDDQYVPTGIYDSMSLSKNKNYNFNSYKKIYKSFEDDSELLKICNGGIDLAYRFIDDTDLKIHLSNDIGDNQLKIYSNQESCVVYTLNKIENLRQINDGVNIYKHAGIAFEMQKLPNYIHERSSCLTDKIKSKTRYEII